MTDTRQNVENHHHSGGKNSLASLTCEDEGIAVLRLQDATNKNTLNRALIPQLTRRLREMAADRAIKVAIFRGLPEVFCAGADRELLLELSTGKTAAKDIILPRLVLDLPFPTIAAMEGHAIGGGLALGLCCDMVLMARESRYGCSFMNLGFTPGMGITRLLQLAVGEYIANEMLYGGQLFRGSHFQNTATTNYILPKAKVYSKAYHLAQRIAEKPRFALEALKGYLSLPRRRAFEETWTVETLMHQRCFAQPGAHERILENYACFEEKD